MGRLQSPGCSHPGARGALSGWPRSDELPRLTRCPPRADSSATLQHQRGHQHSQGEAISKQRHWTRTPTGHATACVT